MKGHKKAVMHLKKAAQHAEKSKMHHEKAMSYAAQIKHEKKEKKLIGKLAKMHKNIK